LTSKPLGRFSLVWPQNRWLRFPDLGLKTDNSGLVIWASKSPRRFLGLGLKTKRVSICQLHHKTDGGRSARDTRQDLVACLTWKQAWLGFLSMTSRLTKARRWVVHVASSWRLRRVKAEDGWVDAMGCVGPFYPNFAIFLVLGHKGSLVISFSYK
jgi:hypothetical protein